MNTFAEHCCIIMFQWAGVVRKAHLVPNSSVNGVQTESWKSKICSATPLLAHFPPSSILFLLVLHHFLPELPHTHTHTCTHTHAICVSIIVKSGCRRPIMEHLHE
ncbi:hypothetical protein GOODEAATRI_029244 [Goodea atripinnis]|uniref:Uncharacterized protein n=1 Tax=Goodea atripinnis TaxID=208336 RepID=A0ABV0NFJ8_9TELE